MRLLDVRNQLLVAVAPLAQGWLRLLTLHTMCRNPNGLSKTAVIMIQLLWIGFGLKRVPSSVRAQTCGPSKMSSSCLCRGRRLKWLALGAGVSRHCMLTTWAGCAAQDLGPGHVRSLNAQRPAAVRSRASYQPQGPGMCSPIAAAGRPNIGDSASSQNVALRAHAAAIGLRVTSSKTSERQHDVSPHYRLFSNLSPSRRSFFTVSQNCSPVMRLDRRGGRQPGT